jgi:hypothetical protein
MKIQELEVKLKSHDWTYEMSDDSSAFSRGRETDYKLRSEAKELGPDAVALYNSYYERYAYPKGNPLKD